MTVSLADAEASKAALLASGEDAMWHNFYFETPEDAVSFANINPAQVAGEFVLAGCDGQWAGAYYF
ncbi:hypothetical protein ACFYN3_28325 [Streptomyces lavendulae]|uniref:hypothetical protein n=1 Tax=Streptomyces lavendulae TaxID=1914 RepID=UPI0036AD6A4B